MHKEFYKYDNIWYVHFRDLHPEYMFKVSDYDEETQTRWRQQWKDKYGDKECF